jgi:hypothetical protein
MADETDGEENEGLDAKDAIRERGFVAGQRHVYQTLLEECARGLGVDSPLGRAAHSIVELEETRAALREICERHGDTDWPNDLYLPDVIRKHLAPYLDGSDEREGPDSSEPPSIDPASSP